MKKIIGMIPVRLGSKRIPKKNLRLINGKPLVSYIIESAIKSKVFDEIYINSESEEFKYIADMYNIKFYKRPSHLSSDTATNDEFVQDFIENVPCENLIQLLATSPFLTSEIITSFVHKMTDENLDTLILTKNEQIECMFENVPINFNQKDKTLPSQLLKPVQVYACGIMGWKTNNFLENIKKYNSGYHGGDGKISTFSIKGFPTIDIDNEEDFKLAEAIFKSISETNSIEYFDVKKINNVESDVPSILIKDGVKNNNFDEENLLVTNLENLIEKNKNLFSWSHRVVNTENNSATIICQKPGEGNRLHYHSNWNEWWYILEGLWEFEIESVKHIIKKGDLVLIQKNKKHKITAIGENSAIRLAVSRQDIDHIYVN